MTVTARRRPEASFRSLALAILLALAGVTPVAQAQSVGVMVEVIRQVTGTPPGGSPTAMQVSDSVLLDTVLETGRASGATMTLDPNGSLQLGADARVVVDRATVDAATGASESRLSVLLGKIRLALSSAFRGEVEIDTPTATIGVKGTVLNVDVKRSGDTVVWVFEGVVEVRSKAGGETVTVTAGQLSTVSRGAPATGPTPFDPATGTAAARVLPPILSAPNEGALDDSPTVPEEGQLPPRRGDDVPTFGVVPQQPSSPPASSSGQKPQLP